MVKYYKDPLDRIFFALADKTRRSIVQELNSGIKTAKELAEPFMMSLPAISKHLKVLEMAKLIKREKRGRQHFFSLQAEGLEAVSNWSEFFDTFWNQNLDNLETYINKKENIDE
ncbi:hypothetical protein A9Q84_14070 [Halobacteriovorax marinus]|uniref:HTH arsR-type domain-containing protein n=1 Tax=Halobacteriovorax marinus TaxID=97084 RepID=A0A1Y5FB49_9BACT|nr:hypothetical protein A9Q84_14070 [Halobacteriovorax marinus]